MKRSIVWTLVALAGIGLIAAFSRRRGDAGQAATPERSDEVVDEWGEESFPASDPPASY
jgi:hypothetical protein